MPHSQVVKFNFNLVTPTKLATSALIMLGFNSGALQLTGFDESLALTGNLESLNNPSTTNLNALHNVVNLTSNNRDFTVCSLLKADSNSTEDVTLGKHNNKYLQEDEITECVKDYDQQGEWIYLF